MDITKMYTREYLDRIDLKKPFLEQDYIKFGDLKDFFPEMMNFGGILYKRNICQIHNSFHNTFEFFIEYRTEEKYTRYKSFRTESLNVKKPFIFKIMIEGGFNWISSIKTYSIWE